MAEKTKLETLSDGTVHLVKENPDPEKPYKQPYPFFVLMVIAFVIFGVMAFGLYACAFVYDVLLPEAGASTRGSGGENRCWLEPPYSVKFRSNGEWLVINGEGRAVRIFGSEWKAKQQALTYNWYAKEEREEQCDKAPPEK